MRRVCCHTWVTDLCPQAVLQQKADIAISLAPCTQLGKTQHWQEQSHRSCIRQKGLRQPSSLSQQGTYRICDWCPHHNTIFPLCFSRLFPLE